MCSKCNNKKWIKCPNCFGDGNLCIYCYGKGEIRCPECNPPSPIPEKQVKSWQKESNKNCSKEFHNQNRFNTQRKGIRKTNSFYSSQKTSVSKKINTHEKGIKSRCDINQSCTDQTVNEGDGQTKTVSFSSYEEATLFAKQTAQKLGLTVQLIKDLKNFLVKFSSK